MRIAKTIMQQVHHRVHKECIKTLDIHEGDLNPKSVTYMTLNHIHLQVRDLKAAAIRSFRVGVLPITAFSNGVPGLFPKLTK